MTSTPAVVLVDDDPAVRKSLSLALTLAGYEVKAHASPEDALRELDPEQRGCLVLDLRMPGMSGLDLQEELRVRGCNLPIIFISAFGDIPATVRAMKGGALDFLEKPFSTEALIGRIDEALATDERQHAHMVWKQKVQERAAELTRRERDVLVLVTEGLSNKDMARRLEISPRTVEKYRARVMEKMQADSIADLCHMATVCVAAEPATQEESD